MKSNNKLDNTFGTLSFIGKFISLCLLCMFFYELYELLNRDSRISLEINGVMALIVFVFLLGAFVGFTTNYIQIDYKNRKVKYATKLFGIIPVGKWTNLTSEMKLGLKKTTERWGAYSMSNRFTSFEYSDLRIILYDAQETEIIPIKKIKKAEFSKEELEKLSKLLKLDIVL